MSEKKQDFPRHYVEFVNPDDKTELFRCDLTWLTSRWTCIWGRGCKGIDAQNPDVGCCHFGAHFVDKKDIKNTKKYIDLLTEDIWQNKSVGDEIGWLEQDDDGEDKTRQYQGACIFHNRNGFEGGDGCALHILAGTLGINPLHAKPQVCWQLPIRRTYDETERPDGVDIMVVGIGEFNRRGWGPNGKHLDWYCTTATEAHVGTKAVFESYAPELIELMGQRAYDILADHCRSRIALIEAVTNVGDRTILNALAIHPADPK